MSTIMMCHFIIIFNTAGSIEVYQEESQNHMYTNMATKDESEPVPSSSKEAVKALKDHEDKLVASLKDTDLVSLARFGLERGFIPQDMKESLESMDPNVHWPTKIRYLFLHVYESLQSNPRLYERWLKLLSKHGASSEALEQVRLSYEGYCARESDYSVSAMTESIADANSEELSGNGSAAGSKRPRNYALLEELALKQPCLEIISQTHDLKVSEEKSTLLEVQVTTNHKTTITYQWMKDGAPLNDSTDCNVHKPILCINDVTMASEGTYHCEVQTHDNKKLQSEPIKLTVIISHERVKALRDYEDELVASLKDADLTSFAKEAETGFIPQMIKNSFDFLDSNVPCSLKIRYLFMYAYERIDNNSSIQYEKWLNLLSQFGVTDDLLGQVRHSPMKRPCLQVTPMEIVRHTHDLKVNEEKSTLFEVQVSTSHDTNITYQWMKDGAPLSDDSTYCGIHKQILCINDVTMASEGTYHCEVQTHENEKLQSYPIKLTVIVPPEKRTLIDRYLSQPEVPEDSWPPVSNNTYINLALIKQSEINKAGEYAYNTIQGDMDDILKDKEKIEYNEVFSRLKTGARLFIEGRPGSGKTTLVHKVSRDWAKNELQLDGIRLLFLVHLQGFFNDPDIQFIDIMKRYYENESSVSPILNRAKTNSGEGLCFILDGLDEYSPKKKNETMIFQLIKRNILPKSVVIVASRPAAVAQLKKVATKRVEVLGFQKEQIFQYIEKYNFSSAEKTGDLHSYLAQHPNIHHMCYLPIHSAMVCFLFDEMGCSLPQTETEMYKNFTNFTLLRSLTRCEENKLCLDSPEDLPAQERKLFLQICKLAFEKTKTSKQVMKHREVNDFLEDVRSSSKSLGLINVDRISMISGFQDLYTFLHLTFQEYLAAYHISQLEEVEQTKVIKTYGKKKHMQVVWKFYCGLDINLTKFEELIKSSRSQDDLFQVQCAFESQQPIICDSVIQSGEEGSLTLKSHFLTPSDMTAIGFIISIASGLHPVNKLVLNRCTLGEEGISAFLNEAGNQVISIQTLCYHGGNCNMAQLRLVNVLLGKMSALETLDISNTKLGPLKIKALTSDIHLTNLKELKSGDLKSQNSVLLSCFRKTSLIHLRDIKLSSDEIKVLSDSFEHCTSLCLIKCKINRDGAKALAEGLKHCMNLQTLNLGSNSIGADGAKALAEGLKHCTNLQTLNLNDNRIGTYGANALVEGLKHCMNLQTLNLRYNSIGSDCAMTLAEGLKHCANLQTLNLRSNSIGTVGAKALADGLKHFTNMQTLNLYLNSIGSDGAKALAKGLKHCTKLQTLNLSSNSIGTDGAVAIAESLMYCMNLQTLSLDDSIGADSAKALAVSLKHCTNLQTLNLYNNSIRTDGAKALADGLMHCTNLQTLSLRSNSISADGAKALAGGLKYCTNLQTLNLRSNSISADSARVLAEGLKHCINLQTLNLKLNSIGADGAKALAESLKHCIDLQSLNLYDNSIGADGAKALAEGLKRFTNLQALNLYNNSIGAYGAKALAEGLKNCTNLQALNLDVNSIGADGAMALSASLKHCTNLQTVNLYDNSIGANGAKALAEGLKHCTNLQTLNLYDNSIGSEGALAIAESLKHCTNLQTLSLDCNSIGTNGATALAEGLKHCTNLETLNLDRNSVGDDGAKALAEGLKYCINLQTLNLYDNSIGTDGARALIESLQHCTNLKTLNLDWNSISISISELSC